MSIKNKITEKDIKKILCNSKNKINFILIKSSKDNIKSILGKSNPNQKELDNWIIKKWNYNIDSKIIRKLYEETDKYKNSILADKRIPEIINGYKAKYNEPLSWPCNQSQFDNLAQRINNQENLNDDEKDIKITKSAIQFRRMKELKTAINDKLEFFVVEFSKNIIPTLGHSGKGDFYIDGILFDQKTTHISKKFTDDPTIIDIIEERVKYGKWLYENQGEDRFDAGNRLFVIYDEENTLGNLTPLDLELSIKNSNLQSQAYECNFQYGKGDKRKSHKAKFKMIYLKKWII